MFKERKTCQSSSGKHKKSGKPEPVLPEKITKTIRKIPVLVINTLSGIFSEILTDDFTRLSVFE